MRSKITVVGAGFVGSTLVQRLVERDYADVVMYDIIPNMPQGKALDMLQAGPVLGYDSLVVGTNDYADTANSDIVVVTSGFPRKPGMSLDDLVKKNQQIVTKFTQEVVNLLGMGSAYFAPSGSVLQMVDSILFDKKMIMPCAVYLQGEYGITGLFVGVPVKLGANGVEQIVEIELHESERALLQKSANAVKELVEVMGI